MPKDKIFHKQTSLAIAFYNIGVEEEYSKNFEQALMNYANAC